MFKPVFKTIKTAKFQLTIIIITILYIVGLLLWQNVTIFYAEKIFTINKIEKSVRRLANNVSVGLHINNFPNFSFNENKFIMDAFVWFKFEVGTESLDTIENFTFRNSNLQDLGILFKSKPMIKLIDNDVVVTYHVQVEFKSPLEQKYFPIADHRLNIILENRSVTPNEVVFSSSLENFVLSEDIFVSTWKPVQKMIQSGYLSSALSEEDPTISVNYPCVVFTIEFENISNRNLVTLYFPMFVVFFIGLLSLIIEMTDTFRLGLIATSLPILVLFRTAIEAMSPVVGSITKVDFVFFLLVFLSLLIILFQAYVVIHVKKIKTYSKEIQERKIAQLENLNNLFFVIIISLLVLLLTYNYFMV